MTEGVTTRSSTKKTQQEPISRRIDDMLQPSKKQSVQRDEQRGEQSQDGSDLRNAMQLSQEDRTELILKLLFEIKADISKIEPLNTRVTVVENKVEDIETSLNRVYERMEENEKAEQQVVSEHDFQELNVKLTEPDVNWMYSRALEV